jgi:hypothetical protein
MLHSRTGQLAAGVALAAGCLVFGAKLMLVHAYGSDVPFMDEWDAVGKVLIIPRALGQLGAGNFLAAQNEHRIVLTRLISYALAVSNGQWDPLLEMTVNAAIHAGLCAALLVFARRLSGGALYAGVVLVITSLFVLTFDWENTLQGLQSQFYLLECGALAVFLLCLRAAPLTPRWWLGWLAAAASLGTMASGFMAAATVLVMMALGAAMDRRLSARSAAAAALLAALCVAGILTARHVPSHEVYRAGSAGTWLAGAARALSWPLMGWPAAFLVLQLPVALLIVTRLRARRVAGDEAVVVALGVWTWMNIAALAYGRANMGMLASSRYSDLYAVGSVAGVLALAILLGRPLPARAWIPLAVAWIALLSLGLRHLGHRAHAEFLEDLPRVKAKERFYVRSFLATGNPRVLSGAPRNELPFPRPEALARLLSDPSVRAMLPLGIRPPIALAPDTGSTGFELASPSPLPLDSGGRVWMARKGPARFVSQPIEGDLLPFMHIAVCGSPDLNASSLHIESASDIEPDGAFPLRSDRWHGSDVPVPRDSTVRVIVDIPTGDHWFAFAEPVELGRDSWADHWLLRRSTDIALCSGVLLGALLMLLLAADFSRRQWW